MSPSKIAIGVLLTFEAQLLDMCGIDLFGMMSKEYMSIAMPKPMLDAAIDEVKILYIGKDNTPGEDGLKKLTAEAIVKAEVSISSPDVQPSAIDILLIPGPPPGVRQPQHTLDFVKAHANAGTTILTVCTGCNVAAQAGILDGRKASGPRALVPGLRKEFPKATWDDQRRWVKDVNSAGHEIWSSGGICNGLEMIAAFIREKYPGPVSEAVCAMADVGDKGEYYSTTVSVDNAWFLGQILRALFFGQRGALKSK